MTQSTSGKIRFGSGLEELVAEWYDYREVTIRGDDFEYHGYLIFSFKKRNGKLRCVIEDENNRLFIQRPDQVFWRTGSRIVF